MKYLKNFVKDESLKIARVDMIFDNHEMINMLNIRGQAIKVQDKTAI